MSEEGNAPAENNPENFGGEIKALTEKEKKVITKLFEKHDTSKDQHLQFQEFCNFMGNCFNADLSQDPEGDVQAGDAYSPNEAQMQFLFKGMDIDGSNNVNQDEICQCFAALKENNTKWLAKIIFRGADKDRSKKISITELQDVASMCGTQITKEQFQEKCKSEFGEDVKELNFAQFYQILTGEKIADDTDPYDGKLKKTSKCCLLL